MHICHLICHKNNQNLIQIIKTLKKKQTYKKGESKSKTNRYKRDRRLLPKSVPAPQLMDRVTISATYGKYLKQR